MDKAVILERLKKNFALDPLRSKVGVIGLGATGVSIAHYLKRLGFDFSLNDSREKPPVDEGFYREMAGRSITVGSFWEHSFAGSTHLLVSPGIALSEAAVVKALESGAKILSDIDLFACSVTAPIVAITGSNGKSTVTTMLGEMAKRCGKRVAVGGNIGVPVLDLLDFDGAIEASAELYVLELSSFQLERTTVLNAAAATVLNISADHLDRHSDITAYAQEKEWIFHGDGCMVINIDDPIVNSMRRAGRNLLTFSIQQRADFYLGGASNLDANHQSVAEKGRQTDGYLMHHEKMLMPLSDLPLEGRHNVANALAALALGSAVGLDEQAMCEALKNFKGLDHRMQRVAQINGVTWVNDSKATNVGACIAALQGYQDKVVLIAGGDAKGADMNELAAVIKGKAKSVVLMGKDAKLIEQALNGGVPICFASSMVQAVSLAAGQAVAGDSVLLSPACASLDQYKNYQDRGEQFKQAVLELQ
jgi:UDP-N-acetylmuramoylalanine--D-glutamate ligase